MKRWLSLLFVILLFASGLALSGCGLQQKKLRSGLQIETGNKQTVAVYLNGTYINQTPLIEKGLKPGKYQLKLIPTDPAYVSYEETVELFPGTVTWMVWNPGPSAETSGGIILEVNPLASSRKWWEFYKPADSQGKIRFQSVPDNAIVSVDSEDVVRFTPSDYADSGEKAVSFSITLPSYETQAHTIELKPGYEVRVTSKLAKKDPLLAATTSQAEILGVEDELTATSPATNSGKVIKVTPTNFIVEGKEVVKIRSAPDPKSSILEYAQVGTTLPATGNRNTDWIEILTASGSGWVSSAFTTEIASPSAQSR